MTPELVQAISGLGALGFAIIAVWALGTGRVRVGTLVDKANDELAAMFEKRLAEVAKERDDWKTLALTATPELKRLNDLLETSVRLLMARDEPPSR